jgi:DNA repair protein RAD5
VLITYATLGHEYKHYESNPPKDNGEKYLFDYEFQRVILDEAHNIRSINTLQFNAVMNLKSMYSWCLTGTLIQNSEQDLFAIFKFLRIEVFSEESWWNQYIKNTSCTQAKLNVIQTVLRPIVLRRTKASTSNQG